MAGRAQEPDDSKSRLVIASFNCEGWDDVIIEDLLNKLSNNSQRKVALFCQETWLYAIPPAFSRKFSKQYNIMHVSAMDPSKPKRAGRPYGGLSIILSKDIAYKSVYEDSRCLSIVLNDYDVLINNVYMPFADSRISAADNVERYMEALGHLDAVHEIAGDVEHRITLGDLNSDPGDMSERAEALALWLNEKCYDDTDLLWLKESDATHKSGRKIDRIFTSRALLSNVSKVFVHNSFSNSDHFPLVCELQLHESRSSVSTSSPKKRLNWKGASNKAISAYANLCSRTCKTDLEKFRNGELNGEQFYERLISNLESAADTCIPKQKSKNAKSHNIPFWRQRMSTYQTTVDYWLQTQFLQGGANRCHPFVREQLRIARARYKRQHRLLRREIQENVANHTTVTNCFNTLFKSSTQPTPSYINGKPRDEHPVMWREHFKKVFKAEETPFNCNLFENTRFFDTNIDFDTEYLFKTDEIVSAILDIDTDKSYSRHHHWKKLLLYDRNHIAFTCLQNVFNFWALAVFSDNCSDDWSLFNTNLSPVPKTGKRDLSLLKSWRPISLGTSENWVLEKIFLSRLKPFLGTDDSQFGYKRGHSTSHAIELVRVLERSSDCHVCMLDASAAFDTVCWGRIRDQLIHRNVPFYLIKLCMKQLTSNRISVCGTTFIFPRAGIKQGGVISGYYFSLCYDELVDILKSIGAGVLLTNSHCKRLLLFILIYADDIILIARSIYGLGRLIDATLGFANMYKDIQFNTSKSWILRLGKNRHPAISIRGIPTSECQEYLGVQIGRGADQEALSATKLYSKTNILLKQNKDLHKCTDAVKNIAINSYGSVYALENFESIGSRLRQSHRYITRAVHTDWRTYADLPGPNIRNRTLYSTYSLLSFVEQHRIRRNNFLIKAAESENRYIRCIIGDLPRITV